MLKLFLLVGVLVFSEKLYSQEIKTNNLTGKWLLDKGKKPMTVEFKDDSIVWNSETKLDGRNSLKYINNENVLTMNINTGGYAWGEEIYLIRRFPYAKFYMLQIPKKNKKGIPIIVWQKHYGKDQIALAKINPDESISK